MNKRNRMEVSVKGLMLAVVVVISLILSAVSLYLVTGAKGMINDGNTQFTQMMGEYSEINAQIYDGMVINGAEVIAVINEMTKTSVEVDVKTKLCKEQQGYIGYKSGATYESKSYKVSDDDYINPNSTFKGAVTRNENGMVTKILFTQV